MPAKLRLPLGPAEPASMHSRKMIRRDLNGWMISSQLLVAVTSLRFPCHIKTWVTGLKTQLLTSSLWNGQSITRLYDNRLKAHHRANPEPQHVFRENFGALRSSTLPNPKSIIPKTYSATAGYHVSKALSSLLLVGTAKAPG